jgi:hypothetical protein
MIITESRYEKWRKKYGNATGTDYVPILKTLNLISKGNRHRIAGYVSKRVHHLRSNLERDAFVIYDWTPNVTDIRERYPLDFEETKRIADELGFSHPYSKKNKEFMVLTTDFLVDFIEDDIHYQNAVSILYSSSLKNKSILKDALIRKIFWEERGVKFSIYTEKSLPLNKAKSIRWFWNERDRKNVPIREDEELWKLESILRNRIIESPKNIIGDLCYEIDQSLKLPPGVSINVVKYMIANNFWMVDMDEALSSNRPLPFIKRME